MNILAELHHSLLDCSDFKLEKSTSNNKMNSGLHRRDKYGDLKHFLKEMYLSVFSYTTDLRKRKFVIFHILVNITEQSSYLVRTKELKHVNVLGEV